MSKTESEPKYPYGYGLSRISLAKLYMNKANVMKSSFNLAVLGFMVVGLWTLIKELFKINTYFFLDSYVLALGSFIWGYLGLFWAYRRQVPQIVTVKGKPAFMMGMFMMIGCWLVTIYSLFYGTRMMIENIVK